MLEIIKKARRILEKFPIKRFSDRVSSNERNQLKIEIKLILNLLSGLFLIKKSWKYQFMNQCSSRSPLTVLFTTAFIL